MPGNAADSRRHLFALDGLRALALLSVVLHHLLPALFAGGTPLRDAARFVLDLGGLGVDLFFALSGFLITGILVDSKGLPHFFSRFYWRRSLRIFPAYFLFLLPLLLIPRLYRTVGRPWFLLYLRNWRGADANSDGILGHLWSLAVEEQFYIVWALAVFLAPRRWLPYLILALSAAALPFRLWMSSAGYTSYEMIRFTPSRMDALLLGGLVALAWRSRHWPSVRRGALPVALLASAGYAVSQLPHGSVLITDARFSFSAVFFAALVALAVDLRAASFPGRILCSRFLARIAKYSYALYLWHLLLQSAFVHGLTYLNRHFGSLAATVASIAGIPVLFAALYGVAALSWRYVEQPALRRKDDGHNPLIPKTLEWVKTS